MNCIPTRISFAGLVQVLMLWALGFTASAQIDRSKAPEPGPAPELNIGTSTEVKLANGMTLIVVENHKTPSVYWSMTLEFQPFQEGDKAGMMDVASAMMSSGTESRTKAEIAEEIEFLGASFNAAATGFSARSLSKHTDTLLEIVADAVLNPTFPQEELDKVKTQMGSSLANIGTSPGEISANLVAAVNYGELHPYGEVMTEESLEAIAQEDLQAYHRKYFRPNVAYLIAIGDITPEEAQAKASKHFGTWRRSNIPFERVLPPAMPKGMEVHFAPVEGAVQSTINVTHAIPFPPGHPDAAAAQVANSILGGGVFSGRLMQNLREDKAFTYGARSSLRNDPVMGQFSAYADVRTEVTDSAVVEFLYEIARIRNTQPDSTEMFTAKASLAGGFARSLESPGTVARFALNTSRYHLPEDYYQTYLSRLEAVTAEDVQRVAQEMIRFNNVNICVVGAPEVMEKLEVFDNRQGIDVYDAFGRRQIPREDAPEGLTVDDVLKRHFEAIGGKKAWGKVKTMVAEGSAEFGVGLNLQFRESTRLEKGNRAKRTEMLMSNQPVMVELVTETAGSQSAMGETNAMDADELALQLSDLSPVRLLSLEKEGYSSRILGVEALDGIPCTLVEFTRDSLAETYWFNSEDGLMIQSKKPMGDGTFVVERLDLYLPHGEKALKVASSRKSVVDGQPIHQRTVRVTFNVDLDDSLFQQD